MLLRPGVEWSFFGHCCSAMQPLQNVRDEDGDTPLHHVAGASELDTQDLRAVVELLLAHGGDPKLKNAEGKTCLDACGEKVLEADDEEQPPEEEELDINFEFVKVLDE